MDKITLELDNIELGDERLNKRSKSILSKLSERSEESLRAAFNGWGETKAAYRFLDNDNVEPRKLIEPHINKTKERFGLSEVILCVQDTTILDYSGRKKEVIGLGKIRKEKEQGLLLHPTIAFGADRLCLGMICYKTWVREELLGKKERSIAKSVEEKESIRWIESYRETEKLAQVYSDKSFINISDREGDFYELFYEHNSQSLAHLIVRAKSNRVLISDFKNDKEHLWEKVEGQKALGRIKFTIRESNKRNEEREVTQTIKVCKIRIGPNLRKGSKVDKLKGSSREITAILATEENSPKGEKKIEWMLLTTMSVNNFNEAIQIVNYYRSRWEIELYFKTLKSGCKIEEVQLESRERIERCLMMYMIVSWRIMFLTMISRSEPELSCEYFYDKSEWNTAYVLTYKRRSPNNPPSIREMNRMVATFGGFLGRKRDGEPGIKAMWIGLRRLADFTKAFELGRRIYG